MATVLTIPTIRVTIRVVSKNQKLGTTQVKSAQADFNADKIIAVIALPDTEPGEPESQIVTIVGPFDVYEKAELVSKKIAKALDPKA